MSVVLSVQHLAKAYRLGEWGSGTLREDVTTWWERRTGRRPTNGAGGGAKSREPFWALDDVSFEVRRGEVLGVIGRNGAGKSTLLKILSRVTAPTRGTVGIRGRVASLLEVGTGFHPELTGRDNIFLNGAILGMSKAEIRGKLDAIVGFAEIGEFIDTPVKRYSSGMYVRLAFAVAAHLEPDILIVDEVLAVGDVAFQRKCLGKMQEVTRDSGRTVLFVSHNMSAVAALCERALVLEGGRLEFLGGRDAAIEHYLKRQESLFRTEWSCARGADTGRPLMFRSVRCRLKGVQPELELEVDLTLESLAPHASAFLALNLSSVTGVNLCQAIPNPVPFISTDRRSRGYRIAIRLQGWVPGIYAVRCWAGPHYTETYDDVRDAVYFEIIESPTPGRTVPFTPLDNGYVVPESRVEEVAL